MSAALTRLRDSFGLAPSQELIDVTQEAGPSTVRKVRRRMRRGEAEPDRLRARVSVALAREHLRMDRAAGPLLTGVFAALVVLWAAMAVEDFITGEPLMGAYFGGVAAWGATVLIMRRRWREGARRAERVNLAVLEADD